MRENDSSFRYGLLVLLIIITILVVNLSTNVLNLDVSDGNQHSGTITSGTSVVSSTESGNAKIVSTPNNQLYYYLIISGLVVALVFFYFGLGRRKKAKRDYEYVFESPPNGGPLLTVLIFGLLLLAFFGILESIRYLAPYLTGANINSRTLDFASYIELVSFVGIGTLSVFGLIFLLRGNRFRIRLGPFVDPAVESQLKVQAFKEILDRAAGSLNVGYDYRSTIIQTYKALCAILAESGVPQEASLTPREFEIEAKKKLGIDSGYLHEATLLFEKARYSDENLTDEDSLKAKNCFYNLSLEIGQRHLDKKVLTSSSLLIESNGARDESR